MQLDTIKLELIEWLAKLNDSETIEYLKTIKDSRESDRDWWNTLTAEQKEGINKGLKDIDSGRTTPHDEVVKKYGL